MMVLCGMAVASCLEPDRNDRDPDCPDPGKFLKEILDLVNQKRDISEVIRGLGLPSETVLGAQISGSLQSSQGTADPRLYFQTPCGPLTTTLYGRTIEVAISGQKADPSLTDPVSTRRTKINTRDKGEILIEIGPFPRSGPALKPADIVNAYNWTHPPDRRVLYDTKKCSQCHVDVGGFHEDWHTGGLLGQRRLKIGGTEIRAVISAYEREPGELASGKAQLCVPGDLEVLRDCTCDPFPDPARCRAFVYTPDETDFSDEETGPVPLHPGETADARNRRMVEERLEACRRIEATLRLRPRQHCQFEPSRQKNGGGCLTGSTRARD